MPSLANSSSEPQPSRRFAQLKPRRNGAARGGLTPEQVASNQRARMYMAMIEIVAERGYAATRIRDLRALAGVSTATVYKEFASKEAYFLATYELIVRRAMKRVNEAYRGETDWLRQLRRGFEVFVSEVTEHPDAAKLALVEALGAGPGALEHMERAAGVFEHMLSTSFAASPEGIALPPLIAKGIVGGISRVTRQRLVEDRLDELESSVEELFGWMLAYHAPGGDALSLTPMQPPRRRTVGDRGGPQAGEERARMMRSAVRLAAEYGYRGVTVDGVVDDARVAEEAFYDTFAGGVEECFLAAYDVLGTQLLASARAPAGNDWPQAVRAGLLSLLWRMAGDPASAQVAFVEVFSVGPPGIACRSRLMQSFGELLLSRAPADRRPSEVVAEAIVGAVWQLAHHVVWHGAAHRLPELTDLASYLVLAPTIGGERAIACIRAGRPQAAPRPPHEALAETDTPVVGGGRGEVVHAL